MNNVTNQVENIADSNDFLNEYHKFDSPNIVRVGSLVYEVNKNNYVCRDRYGESRKNKLNVMNAFNPSSKDFFLALDYFLNNEEFDMLDSFDFSKPYILDSLISGPNDIRHNIGGFSKRPKTTHSNIESIRHIDLRGNLFKELVGISYNRLEEIASYYDSKLNFHFFDSMNLIPRAFYKTDNDGSKVLVVSFSDGVDRNFDTHYKPFKILCD